MASSERLRLRPEERALLLLEGRCARCPHLVVLHPVNDVGERLCLLCSCGNGTQRATVNA